MHILPRGMTVLALGAAAALIAACGSDSDTESTGSAGADSTAKTTEIRIQDYGPGEPTGLQLVVADKKGMFAEHGLKPRFINIPSGALGVKALASDSLEFMASATESQIVPVAQGADVKIVAAKSKNNIYSVLANKEVALPHLSEGYPAVMQDLKGKKIGVFAHGTAGESYFTVLLEEAGLKAGDVTFVEVGAAATAYPALTNHRVDAVVHSQPLPALCEINGNCTMVVDLTKGEGPESIVGLNGISLSHATSGKYLESHPEVVDSFIAVVEEAQKWMTDSANFDELLAMAKEGNRQAGIEQPDAVVEALVRSMVGNLAFEVPRDVVQRQADFLQAHGLIDKKVDANSMIYDNAP